MQAIRQAVETATYPHVTISGPITQSGGALSSNGVVLHTHTHSGDSGGTTGGPQ